MTAVVTTAGAALIAAATTGDPLELTQIAVGDGNGAAITPAAGMTALVHERARVDVSDFVVVGNVSRFRAVFVPGATGYTMREAGIFAGATLVAIMSLSPQDMPTQAWATANNQVIETTVTIALVVTDADTVTVNVSASGYATIGYVDAKVPPFASLAEHQQGSTGSKMVRPDYAKQVLDEHRASRDQHPTGTQAQQGFLRLATNPESLEGVLATVAVPPSGLKAAIEALKGGVSAPGDTLKELYDLIIALQGADASILAQLANLATFAHMPIYPECRNPAADAGTEDRFKIMPSRVGSNLVVPTGKYIVHRGGKAYYTVNFDPSQLTFPLANNKRYHLRWYAPGHAQAPQPQWPNGRFMLHDVMDLQYNPAWAQHTNVQFDSRYDDALIADVNVAALGETYIVPLINKNTFDMTAIGGGMPNGGPGVRTDTFELNFARTPSVSVSARSYTTGGSAAPGIPEFEVKTTDVSRMSVGIQFSMAKGTDLRWSAQVTLLGVNYFV